MSEQIEQQAAPAAEEQKTENVPVVEKEEIKENGTGDANEAPADSAATPKEMRAVILTGFGGLKTVKTQKKNEPTVSEGEVLIRVKAW